MSWSQMLPMLCRIGITICLVFVSHFYDVKGDVIAFNAENKTERFNSMPSNFGSRIPSDGIVVFNAQRAGYMGVIVHNVGSDAILPMSGAKYAGQVFIPSVFVGYHDGMKLGEEYNYTSGYSLKITPGFIFPYHIYLIPFAAIVGVCFILMVGFMTCEINTLYHTPAGILSLPIHHCNWHMYALLCHLHGDDYDVCAICLDEYEEGDKLRILPCNHAFHSKCVDPWLTNNKRTCPVYKRKVVPNGVEDSSDSEDSSDDEDGPNEYTPLLTASGSPSVNTPEASPSESPVHVDASTTMTPMEESDEESAVSSSDSYEMSHTQQAGELGCSRPLQPVTEIQIEHEVVIERPDVLTDDDDDIDDDDDDDKARLQKV